MLSLTICCCWSSISAPFVVGVFLRAPGQNRTGLRVPACGWRSYPCVALRPAERVYLGVEGWECYRHSQPSPQLLDHDVRARHDPRLVPDADQVLLELAGRLDVRTALLLFALAPVAGRGL